MTGEDHFLVSDTFANLQVVVSFEFEDAALVHLRLDLLQFLDVDLAVVGVSVQRGKVLDQETRRWWIG